jgi:hypothetical protein
LVRGYRTLVFKTSSIGRSDNLPDACSLSYGPDCHKKAAGEVRRERVR